MEVQRETDVTLKDEIVTEHEVKRAGGDRHGRRLKFHP